MWTSRWPGSWAQGPLWTLDANMSHILEVLLRWRGWGGSYTYSDFTFKLFLLEKYPVRTQGNNEIQKNSKKSLSLHHYLPSKASLVPTQPPLGASALAQGCPSPPPPGSSGDSFAHLRA